LGIKQKWGRKDLQYSTPKYIYPAHVDAQSSTVIEELLLPGPVRPRPPPPFANGSIAHESYTKPATDGTLVGPVAEAEADVVAGVVFCAIVVVAALAEAGLLLMELMVATDVDDVTTEAWLDVDVKELLEVNDDTTGAWLGVAEDELLAVAEVDDDTTGAGLSVTEEVDDETAGAWLDVDGETDDEAAVAWLDVDELLCREALTGATALVACVRADAVVVGTWTDVEESCAVLEAKGVVADVGAALEPEAAPG